MRIQRFDGLIDDGDQRAAMAEELIGEVDKLAVRPGVRLRRVDLIYRFLFLAHAQPRREHRERRGTGARDAGLTMHQQLAPFVLNLPTHAVVVAVFHVKWWRVANLCLVAVGGVTGVLGVALVVSVDSGWCCG